MALDIFGKSMAVHSYSGPVVLSTAGGKTLLEIDSDGSRRRLVVDTQHILTVDNQRVRIDGEAQIQWLGP